MAPATRSRSRGRSPAPATPRAASPGRRSKKAAAPASRILAGHVIVAYVVASTAGATYWHATEHGGVSYLQAFLAFFLGLNALICYWEIALCYRIDHIARKAAALRRSTGDSQAERFAAVGAFFALPCPVSSWGCLTYWARVWWTYAIYDPSYADKTTFGFWIDTANGHVTLLPTLLWLYGMTAPVMPARAFGLIGLVAFYQEWLGTVIYFCTFFANGRHEGKTPLEIAVFVGLTNGIWFFAPLVGAWAALRCVYADDYAVFLP
mmetsp:Transcript_5936/g.17523  ORF Transcript_5936/g.17523 Transcript_5936/m.17523 type:complete len:264 (-) Transcript_5936:36-827(-)